MDSVVIGHGQHIAYQRAGRGAALILLHGFIADSRVWRTQLDDFARDYDVIAWDAPGCGGSFDPPEGTPMAAYAQFLAAFIEALSVERAHLLGLSWGGTLAIEFARLFPERVRSLILADTYAGWTGSLGSDAAEQRLARCLRESELPPETWVRAWVPDATMQDAAREELAEIMWSFHPSGFRAMARNLAPDVTASLAAIHVPTLLIWGASDERSPVSIGEAMLRQIAGARLVVIEGAGHVSNMDQPAWFNAEVRAFLSGLE